MNVFWGALVTLAVVAVAIAAMLLVRRRAPDGGYFTDGDRAAGVFGVLATGFSVLLGFIVFLAFTSYDQSRTGAETEALVVVQQFQTAQFFPATASARADGRARLLRRDRSSATSGRGWRRGRRRRQPVGVALFRTLKSVQPQSASEQSAYDKWLEQTSDARGRPGRTGSTARWA